MGFDEHVDGVDGTTGAPRGGTSFFDSGRPSSQSPPESSTARMRDAPSVYCEETEDEEGRAVDPPASPTDVCAAADTPATSTDYGAASKMPAVHTDYDAAAESPTVRTDYDAVAETPVAPMDYGAEADKPATPTVFGAAAAGRPDRQRRGPCRARRPNGL